MNRRARALIFFGLAALAGVTGAGMVDSYQEQTLAGLGELQPVVVTAGPLPAAQTITAEMAERRLKVVRVPARFASTGSLAEKSSVIGLRPLGDLPAGTFLSSALMRRPSPRRQALGGSLDPDRRPVEIRITGATALETGPRYRAVDVVVTSEPGPNSSARTYVAAAGVPLIRLAPAADGGEPGSGRAVLALTRPEALKLIRAESFARAIRLLPRPGSR